MEMPPLPHFWLLRCDVSLCGDAYAVGGELTVSKVDKRTIHQYELRVFQNLIQPLVAAANAQKVWTTSSKIDRQHELSRVWGHACL